MATGAIGASADYETGANRALRVGKSNATKVDPASGPNRERHGAGVWLMCLSIQKSQLDQESLPFDPIDVLLGGLAW